ncbi:DUF1707 domain-containing protein [Nocardioides sp.]|uniref:DUF1707 SHOCT-like domain-containing protein n=1 Tax=Nocardioides sp. TaxID=35761 RepID=UPI00272506BD|nr:DUF1707 domain-containing protein [Nocardioides sp.]MDO9456674.1 DUF1707 domain-containing protein [Nocardioides sp.]
MTGDLWSAFPLDPRDRGHAGLRASDEDRERITGVLSTAFADGRLDRDELEERIDKVNAARTLGELPPLVADLVPLKTPPPRSPKSLVGVPSEVLHQRAVERWGEQRRHALFTLLLSSLITWFIWLAASGGDTFPWPVFVTALGLLNVVKVVSGREQTVRDEVRRLEKKQARQQRWPKGLP